ncbi:hypothetical protein DSLASN_05760 [Desulfoluna limicola]|uniref:histidine kinase n=1 Tax=Desulfoluna limicola TaxID=2810562 RepID=A0ABM7PBA1_9BACT|nr:HAMP domain-containing protein [Desulfoluna limicola]BCS94944.1 hypothetical protein DSLASN_05760 [Desulfoluna limicola]
MDIICNHCGKSYTVDPSKLTEPRAKARCLVCGRWFAFDRHNETTSSSPPLDENIHLVPETAEEPQETPTPWRTPTPAASSKRKGIGLTGKFILFSIIPFLVVCAGSLWYFTQMVMPRMDTQITETVSDAIWTIEQGHLREKTRSNARQVRQYLFSHPDLISRNFNRDIYFKKIAIQKIGASGYTFLYELPGPDGIWRSWAHINPTLVGKDLTSLKESQPDFSSFWQVLTAVKNNATAEGFYNWSEKGEASRWYMSVSRVRGTPYVVGTAFKAGEIEKSIATIRERTRTITTQTLWGTLVVMGLGAALAALIFILYGRRTTRRIIHLSSVADRISLGELDIVVNVDSKDEIGELAEAISRMRNSISVAIDRLRRKKHR